MTDTSNTDRAAIRRLLEKLEEARLRDTPDFESSPEDLAREEARFYAMLREESGGRWTRPRAKEGAGDGKSISVGMRPSARADPNPPQAHPPYVANDDDREDFLMAAAKGEATGWSPTGYVLRLPDRVLEAFENKSEDNCMFVPAGACDPGWSGLRFGGFDFDFERDSPDSGWIKLLGCLESTLRKAAGGGRGIDADPF